MLENQSRFCVIYFYFWWGRFKSNSKVRENNQTGPGALFAFFCTGVFLRGSFLLLCFINGAIKSIPLRTARVQEARPNRSGPESFPCPGIKKATFLPTEGRGGFQLGKSEGLKDLPAKSVTVCRNLASSGCHWEAANSSPGNTYVPWGEDESEIPGRERTQTRMLVKRENPLFHWGTWPAFCFEVGLGSLKIHGAKIP